MTQDSNKLNGFEIEIHLRLSARNYRLQFRSAAGWIVAIILVLAKIGIYLMRHGP